MSLKKFLRRKSDRITAEAEILAGIREAEAARRSGTRQDDEDEGEEARTTAAATGADRR